MVWTGIFIFVMYVGYMMYLDHINFSSNKEWMEENINEMKGE